MGDDSTPVCPSCGCPDDCWWERSNLNGDGDEADIECLRCGVVYHVAMTVFLPHFESTAIAVEVGCV